MKRLPAKLAAGSRTAWRAAVPVSLRRAAHPLVMRMLEHRVRRALVVPEPAFKPGPLIVSGLLAEAKGVSEGARLTVAGLRAAGFDVIPHDLRVMFEQGIADGRCLSGYPPGGVWIVHANAPEALYALGRVAPEDWRGRYRIAYWAYELSRVPAEWVRIARGFHEIWAPSQFVVDALLASGVDVPVRLAPHPVALGPPPEQSSPAEFGLSPDGFNVLALGDLLSSAARKNLLGAISIFTQAFPREGEAQLLVKLREAEPHAAFVARAHHAAAQRRDIRFLTGDLAADDARRLIASASVLLSPHRAEGFGLPLAEALLAGVPVLATGWSGNMEFMSGLPDLLIASTQTPVRDPQRVYRAPGQTWAEPNIADAARRLRVLADTPDLRRELAAQGRAAVLALSDAWSRETLLKTALGRFVA